MEERRGLATSNIHRQLWSLWACCLALLALEVAAPHLVAPRQNPWAPAQTAVAGFVLTLLALTAAVSTFATREELDEDSEGGAGAAPSADVAGIRATFFWLWARCLLIGLFGCAIAYGAASLAVGWPFLVVALVLLLIHAPRHVGAGGLRAG